MSKQALKIAEASSPVVPADPMISLIERVLMDAEMPIEKVSAMMDLHERQLNKAAEQEFNRAFAAAMADMPDVPKSGFNSHLKRHYSTLDDLIKAARPALSKHGLSLNWQANSQNDVISVRAIVRHSMGHSISTELSAPRDKSGSMNLLQGGGSTETYLKRYTGFSILGASSGDEIDDDGSNAEQTEFINEKQYIELRALLEKSGMEEEKFHTAFGHKNPSQADLHLFPATRFEEAKKRLNRRIKSGDSK